MTESIPITLTEEQLKRYRDGAPLIVSNGNGGPRYTADPKRAAVSRKMVYAILALLMSNLGGIAAVLQRLDEASRDRFGGAHFSEVQRALQKRNTVEAMHARGGWEGLDAADIVAIQRTVALRHDL